MKKIFTHPFYRLLIALICCVLWGSAFPALKISYAEFQILPDDSGSLLLFAGCRFFLASLLLFIFTRFIKGKIEIPGRKELLLFLGIGFFQTFLLYLFFYTGLVRTPGTISSIINSSGIFFTVILARIFFVDDKITWQKQTGILMGFLGIIIVNGGMESSKGFVSLGAVLLLISSLTGALGGIFIKKASLNRSPLVLTSWQMLFGSLLLVFAGVLVPRESAFIVTNKAVALFFYSAFLSAMAFSLWNTLLKYNKAGEVVFFRFAIPLFGTLLSALFLKESITLSIIIPLVLVSSGILLVTFTPSEKTNSKINESNN